MNTKLFGNAYKMFNSHGFLRVSRWDSERGEYVQIGSFAGEGATKRAEDRIAEDKAALMKNELLADFGARTLAILSSDQDWSSETLAEIARAADALKLSKYDDEGFFGCGIEQPTNAGRAQHARSALNIQGATESADTQERLLTQQKI